MRARLFAQTGELAGTSFEIGAEATFGRLPENQIVLPGGLVSGRHGRIFYDPKASCYMLEDLGSRNGTFLAGSRIREPEKLGGLEVVNIAGTFDLIFQSLPEETGAAPPPPAKAAPAAVAGGTLVDREGVELPASLAADGRPPGGTLAEQPLDWVLPAPAPAPPRAPRFALQVEREGGTEIFDLPPGEHLLGRAADCAIAIDDRGLSRQHARLIVAAGRVSVVDLGSTNRTYVSGTRVLDDPVAVEPGADLVFGGVKATVIHRAPP
jgi:putative serine protease PepD